MYSSIHEHFICHSYCYCNNQSHFSITDSEDIKCYIHAVSPVKDAKFSGRKYFNCTVQKKDGPVRAVCFSPNKHSEFTTLQKAKSPVKVSNYTKSTGKDIVFNQYTKITPTDDIDFQHSAKLLASGVANTIASLNEVAPEQLVSVKAEIAEVSGVKTVKTQHQGTLKKQEVLIRDATSSMKVVLWEDNVDQLQQNKTYLLKNLKVKVSNRERYLNTPKDDEFTASEEAPFKKPLVQFQKGLFEIESSTISGTIIGIHETKTNLSCVSCKKIVCRCPDDDDLGECQSQTCKLKQMLSLCGTQWFLRLVVQNSKNKAEKKRLSFNHQEVEELFQILDISLNLDTTTESDLIKSILKANKVLNITFDTFTGKFSGITNCM